jgi:hypothetical protein
MSFKTHPWHFGAWAFSAVMFFATWRVNAGKKEAKFQERREFYMEAGTYKHPWELSTAKYNDPAGLDAVRGKDYVSASSKPKGLRSRY